MSEASFAEVLEVLGHTDDTLLSLCTKPVGGAFEALVNQAAVVKAAAAGSYTSDTWFGVNPVAGPPRVGRRGGAESVIRLAAVWIDIDVKEGACPDLETAHVLIDDVAGIVGRPSVIIRSGHGLQPLWPIEDGDIFSEKRRAEMATLLKRWGRLVSVVAERRGVKVDALWDLPRILRVPGTINHKAAPVPCGAEVDTGAPMTVEQLEEILDEYGVQAMPADELLAEPVSTITPWAETTCRYVEAMIAMWNDDDPPARHPWLIAQATRLGAARRLGCITEDDYRDAQALLDFRMSQLCARDGTTRGLAPFEVRDALIWGEQLAARKREESLHAELGNHHEDKEGEFEEVSLAEADWAVNYGDFRGPVGDSGGTKGEPAPVVQDDAESATAAAAATPGDMLAQLEAIEDQIDGGFWNARESLQSIFVAGLARLASPWALLGVCMCRALSQVPYWVTLPPLVGGRGSLNFFTAVVAGSGGGKGSAEAAAKELLPLPDLKIGNVGSGEGLAHFYGKRVKGQFERTAYAVHFQVPEIDTMAAISGGRQGSTLMSKLREAYSGESLEFGYATAEKRLPVGEHEYRMTLSLGVQPGRVATLLEDADGGTPQRFIWVPALDARIGYNPPPMPAPLDLPAPTEWMSTAYSLEVPEVTREEVIRARVERMRGNADALDGHALFTREKVMVALAVLDGRTEPTEDDWRLAGVVMDVSDWQRQKLVDAITAERERAAEIRGHEQGITRVASEDVAYERRVQQVAIWIERAIPKMREQGIGISVSALRRRQRSDRRDLIEPALRRLIDRYDVDPLTGEVTEKEN